MGMAWKQLLAIGLCSASASVAHAHISLEEGGTHMSRSGDVGDAIKNGPCGGGTRGANVYTYRPGETIDITIAETIPHPGYFRIAFDADGDDDFEVPSGTDGADGNCGLPADPACGPGKEDYCNNATVLLDHLNQHSSAEAQATYTFSVTLPNVECDNCTLQIIQMMNDLWIHGSPYPADDLYYQCIDLVLSNTAPEVNDVAMTNDGMVCPGGGGAGMGGTGGAAGGSGMGGEGGAAGSAGAAGGGAGVAGAPMAGAGVGGAGTGGAGAGGAPGAAGMTGGAGIAAPLPPVMMPTGTGSSSSNADEGGCRAANGAATSSAGAMGLALLMLAARRRRLHS